MMFHTGDDDLLIRMKESLTKRGGHQVDTFRSATGEDDFAVAAGMNKLLHLPADSLITLGGEGCQMVGATMDITIECKVIVGQSVDHPAGFLRGGSIVEVYQRMVVYFRVENGDIHKVGTINSFLRARASSTL